jgi:hypothetical protein
MPQVGANQPQLGSGGVFLEGGALEIFSSTVAISFGPFPSFFVRDKRQPCAATATPPLTASRSFGDRNLQPRQRHQSHRLFHHQPDASTFGGFTGSVVDISGSGTVKLGNAGAPNHFGDWRVQQRHLPLLRLQRTGIRDDARGRRPPAQPSSIDFGSLSRSVQPRIPAPPSAARALPRAFTARVSMPPAAQVKLGGLTSYRCA